eukprot:TRINITY_DN52380_c0_g1_i1.p1 TRINITY_DN52380_c0_g1~~TRINITY_DN52380_c0_g1_i1.p1  ORF type:complete len:259 (-),score=42.18 TRINITY_DN52380_c0_g1_i1:52-720(-)
MPGKYTPVKISRAALPPRGRSPGSPVHSVRPPGRSPSPPRINPSELDHRSIVALSQSTNDELDIKTREKNALSKLLSDLKKKKLQLDSKLAKKQRDVDTTVVQTQDMSKKLDVMAVSNKMMSAELAGLRGENEKMDLEVDQLKQNLKEATANYERECMEVEKARKLLHNYRKEITLESKHRDNVQSDLRASRTAQSLMINRLDEMEKRNRALKTCVADIFKN